LNFEIRAYVSRIDDYLQTISDLHCAVDQEFRKAGIEIAFPQRDIHVRSIKATLPLANSNAAALERLDTPGPAEADKEETGER
jgi:potassium efflux system protein